MEYSRILLISENPDQVRAIKDALAGNQALRHPIRACPDLEQALSLLNAEEFDICLLDLELTGANGLSALNKITARTPNLAIVVLSGGNEADLAPEAVRAGAQDLVSPKGLQPERLTQTLSKAIERQNLLNQRLNWIQELERSERSLLHIIEQNHDGMMVVDLAGMVLLANRAAHELFGKSAGELAGKELGIPLANRQSTELEIPLPLKGQEPGEPELRLAELRVSPLLWAKQEARLVTLRDISERRQTERALQKSEAFAVSMIEGSPDCIKLLDGQANLIYINAGGRDLFGMDDPDRFINKPYLNMWLDSPFFDLIKRAVQDALAGRGRSAEAFLPDLKKRPKWWKITFTPLADWQKDDTRILVITRDITASKKTELQLWEAKEEAETANQAKSRFLANISHEIRTPMNAIIGFTHLVLEETLDPQKREYLQIVTSSAAGLLKLINELLDLSKIEAGKMELFDAPFNLHACLKGLADSMALQAGQKGLILNLKQDPELPAQVIGDEGKLRQVLLNLVDNAIKFTSQGEVVLKAAIKSRQNSLAAIEFTVRDSGIGIADRNRELIFQPFNQAEAGHHRQYGGTGLGLTMSKHLVEMMGGQIWVSSEPGEGSIFRFIVDFELQPGQQIKTGADGERKAKGRDSKKMQSKMRILMAEDNQINQKLADIFLKRLNCEVMIAQNGEEALEMFQKHSFDLVLMDVEMPKLDGFRATQLIRRLESAGQDRVPIVAMTAHAMKGYRERCLDAGMDDYLTKPLDLENLARVVEHYRPQAAGEE